MYMIDTLLQLRRMKKNSNFSDRVILTAIPEYRSKVLFTFQRPLVPSSPQRHSTPAHGIDTSSAASSSGSQMAEDLAGFIMFECGLEDISLKAAKRSGFQGTWIPEDEDNMADVNSILNNMQEEMAFTNDGHSRAPGSKHNNLVNNTRSSSSNMKNDVDNTKESDTGSANASNASGLGNSADDEDSSWHSRVSISSNMLGDNDNDVSTCAELQGDASSCVLEFKTQWFNFAAPPPSPRKRKLEYTRSVEEFKLSWLFWVSAISFNLKSSELFRCEGHS